MIPQRLDIDSAQSQANANYVAGFGVNLAVSPVGSSSQSEAEQFKIATNYLIIGDSIDFTGQSRKACTRVRSPALISRLRQLAVRHSQPSSGGGTALVNIRPDDVATVKGHIHSGVGPFNRSGGVIYAMSSTDGLVVAEIPISASDYSLEFNGTGAIKSVEVEPSFTAER